MMERIRRLTANRSGSAAAELALVLPLLAVLLFGSVEVGYYFMSEHIVQKSVRDAARYAARLPMSNYDCATNTLTDETSIQRVAKAGDPDGDFDDDGNQDQRLAGWTSDAMTTVTLSCHTDTTLIYVNKGVYADFPNGAPVVTVSAQVPYSTLFGSLGFGRTVLNLNATSEAAVFGA